MVAGRLPQAHTANPADVSGCFHQQHITIVPMLTSPGTRAVQPLHIAFDHAEDSGALLCSVVAGRAPLPLLGDAGMLVAHAGVLRLLTWRCVRAGDVDAASTVAGAPDLSTATTVAGHNASGRDVLIVRAVLHAWSWDPEPMVLEALAGPWGPDVRLGEVAVDVVLAPPLLEARTSNWAPCRGTACRRAAGHAQQLERARVGRGVDAAAVHAPQALSPPRQAAVQLLVAALATGGRNDALQRVALLDVELDPASGAAQVQQLSQVHVKQGARWSSGMRCGVRRCSMDEVCHACWQACCGR